MITNTHRANGQIPHEHQWRVGRAGQTIRANAADAQGIPRADSAMERILRIIPSLDEGPVCYTATYRRPDTG
eukprot:11639519-Prorocentrum_lima.AAC.1